MLTWLVFGVEQRVSWMFPTIRFCELQAVARSLGVSCPSTQKELEVCLFYPTLLPRFLLPTAVHVLFLYSAGLLAHTISLKGAQFLCMLDINCLTIVFSFSPKEGCGSISLWKRPGFGFDFYTKQLDVQNESNQSCAGNSRIRLELL